MWSKNRDKLSVLKSHTKSVTERACEIDRWQKINQATTMNQDLCADFKQGCQLDEKVKQCTQRLAGIKLPAWVAREKRDENQEVSA